MTIKKIPSISAKTLGYSAKDLRKLVDGVQGAVFIARVGGIAASHFIGESKYGEWVGFKGRFFAMTKDKDSFDSSVIFLPANIANNLRDQLEKGVVEVEIKADIYVVETDKNASGYAYMCEPVMSESSDRRSEELAKQVFGGKLPTSLQLEDKTAKKKTA
jgi:hypothetical protein